MLINKPHKRHHLDPENFLIKELGLNNDQKENFLTLDGKHRTKMVFYDEEIRKLKEQMFHSLEKNEEVDHKVTQKMGELMIKKENEIFSFFKEIRSICNEEQLRSLKKIIEKAIMHPGGNPPPPHM